VLVVQRLLCVVVLLIEYWCLRYVVVDYRLDYIAVVVDWMTFVDPALPRCVVPLRCAFTVGLLLRVIRVPLIIIFIGIRWLFVRCCVDLLTNAWCCFALPVGMPFWLLDVVVLVNMYALH